MNWRARDAVAVLLLAAAPAYAEVSITVDRNTGAAANGQFKFRRVSSPAKDDAGTNATLTLVAGTVDGNSAGLAALTDGRLPAEEDQPQANLFFRAGTWGGRVRFDFGNTISIAEIHSYSWHPESRAPQLYKVYGSDGSDPSFNILPGSKIDPVTCGWRLIAFVDTRAKEDEGGQYGVSIADSSGTVGSYRYLLFDFFETEGNDNWGNTFYSEIDVVERK